ncbi:asparagine synthetase B family protein [Thiocystis violascens]|uniref:asparagine synthase (glutamine-hydrolyzing) n=1 Tax=Thiocystis violascens (strain ATCC 17096 / DSM 198 / 6111) TaxID=765911 RepID=I3YFW8_THIV6|nr:asparagine synthase-related protein [Thiocystis violascens]AFL75886.1 asparagine synthase (glutamine-hydrolyzing) [Thiocystis violascens DSM 198]
MTTTLDPPGFLVLWDPTGFQRLAATDWAERRGGGRRFSAGPVEAFGFGGDAAPLAVWSGDETSGLFLGELHEPERLRAELAAVGVPAAADPAALIAAVYAAWGEGGFARLEGVFCTVLWDARTGTLVLYRDGSCAQSLYWYQVGEWAVAATRLDLLTTLPGVPKAVAPQGLHEYLRFLDISPPNCIYVGIRALEPGLPARFGGSDLSYPGPAPFPPGRARNRSGGSKTPPFEACVDALDAALQASVAARLNRDRPTGVFLSGGIDSALLCAIAAKIDRDAIDAFTLGFQGDAFDETPVASRIAESLGIRHHVIRYDLAVYADAFDDFLATVDLPFADPAGLPTLLLYRECRKTVDAVLDGTGADTLLGVMPARHTRIATQYAVMLPRPLRHAVAELLRQIPRLAGYAPMFDFETPEDFLIRWKGWSRPEIETLCDTPVTLAETRFFRLYRQFPRAAHFERYSALMGNLPDDRVHQAAASSDLRIRFPYWDRRVEELVHRLPRPARDTAVEPKRLLRALLALYVPRERWDLPKHGFDFPFVSLLRHEDDALVRRYLDHRVLARHRLIREAAIAPAVERFRAGDNGLAFRVWALVVLFGWLERHA